MKIKRYVAADMRQALKLVRDEQGPDAVILSTRHLDEGLELIAAVDYDETLVEYAMGRRGARAGNTGGEGSSERHGKVPGRDHALEADPEPDQISLSSKLPADASAEDQTVRSQGARESGSPQTARSRCDTQAPAAGGEQPQAAAIPESSLVSMRREISVLKRMLETQISSLAWNDLSRRHPVRAAVLRDLIRMGLAPDLAQDLASRAPVKDGDSAATWRGALGGLLQQMKIAEIDPLAAGGMIALVGPTGVGKTTTIAKLAARYALRNGLEKMALISADDYRIGAQEQLFIYGRELNVPVYVARNGDELRQRVERLTHADLIMIDTAGVSQRDTRLIRALESLQLEGRPVASYLVLAANAQMEAIDEAVAAFSRIPLAGSIITKLDEAASLGGVLSVLARHKLPVTWVADGQEVPENLRRASARHLISQAVGLMKKSSGKSEDHALARHITEARYANA